MIDINGPAWGHADGRLYQIINGPTSPPHDIIIDHNTAFQSGNVITVGDILGNPVPNFVFTNNIQRHNRYGIIGSGTGIGDDSISAFFAQPVITHNVMEALPTGVKPSDYPPGNFFPPDWATAKFTDFAGGNFLLLVTSPYHNAGTDGKDIGADITTVLADTAGVVP
jgi:hypothetical protein